MERCELNVGDRVRVQMPRTRWDHRTGVLHEIKAEKDSRPTGLVILDGIAMPFQLEKLYSESWEPLDNQKENASFDPMLPVIGSRLGLVEGG